MPEAWYDIKKEYFLDPRTGEVTRRFVIFRCGVVFEGSFETYEEAEAEVTIRLTTVR